MSGASIRKTAGSDRRMCIEVLTAAFNDDPVINWLVRQDHRREAALEGFFQVAFDKLTFPFGEVHVTNDGSGAALWNPPGTWKLGLLDQLALLPDYLQIFKPSRLLRVAPRIEKIQRLHPHFPHYYLFAMGVRPSAQGRGLGSALLQRVLAECDEKRLRAYLEATTARNVDLYIRHGFRLTGEFPLEQGGPVLRFMLRDPADSPPGHTYA